MSKGQKQARLIALKAWLKFSRPYYGKLLLVLTIFIIANILLAVIPVFIGALVEAITNDRENTSRIWLYVGILIACSSLHSLIWRGAEFAYRGLVNEINWRYESFLFKAIVNKPYPFFVDKLTGKISSYITMISSEFKGILSNVLFDFSGAIVGVVATVLILGSLNWQTAVIFSLCITGMLVVGRYTLAYNMKHEGIAADKDSSKNGILFDAIANFASIKALRTEDRESRIINREQDTAFKASQKAFLTGIIFWGSMSVFVRDLMWPAALILNVIFFLNGTLTIGQFATLLSTILIFSATVWEGVWYISQFGQKMAKVDEAHLYLFGNTTNIAARSSSVSPPQFKHSVSINRLSFAYPDKPDVAVLKDISITINHGEKIGIVGRSGSGKSTLTKLLLDYYPTKDGAITIDGKNASSKQFAQLVAFVPQDTALFHRTIAENIAYGKPEKSSFADIKTAAKLAEAHEFIKALPGKYETLIGERGVKLSGGQRQRIAIARAILQDAPILVLDEATSALDSESEVLIQSALWKLMEDRTAIVIAHRLSTIQKMDRIIVFDNGAIVEEGTHSELLKKKGMYAKLWAHQSGGFIDE